MINFLENETIRSSGPAAATVARRGRAAGCETRPGGMTAADEPGKEPRRSAYRKAQRSWGRSPALSIRPASSAPPVSVAWREPARGSASRTCLANRPPRQAALAGPERQVLDILLAAAVGLQADRRDHAGLRLRAAGKRAPAHRLCAMIRHCPRSARGARRRPPASRRPGSSPRVEGLTP